MSSKPLCGEGVRSSGAQIICNAMNEELQAYRMESINVRRMRLSRLFASEQRKFNAELSKFGLYIMPDIENVDIVEFMQNRTDY